MVLLWERTRQLTNTLTLGRRFSGGQMGAEVGTYTWEALTFEDFTYDFAREVLKFTNSTYHFMVCFEGLRRKVLMLWCILEAGRAKYCKLRSQFHEISDSMVQNSSL